MTGVPLLYGQFVWCNFPTHEQPVEPGPPHIVYILAVSGAAAGYAAMVAYTTSQPRPDPLPMGSRRFSVAEAEALGQERAFILNLGRIALLPVNSIWFPQFDEPGHGVAGRASKQLRAELEQETSNLFQRRQHVIERLGPPIPGLKR